MIDLDKLRELALAADGGEWRAAEFEYSRGTHWEAGGDEDWFVHNGQGNLTGNSCFKEDAIYIAAACPKNILEILSYIDELESQLAIMQGRNS